MVERETTSHDQIFKDILRAFFHEFLTLFLPLIAASIHPDDVVFLDPQTFTDVPRGRAERMPRGPRRWPRDCSAEGRRRGPRRSAR